MLTKQEIAELLEDFLAVVDHKHLVDDLASKLEPVFKKVYEKGYKDGAGDLPF